MISLDRDALVCDLAETYGIFDWNTVPVSLLATLAAGLRDDSRIKKKILQKKMNEPDYDTGTLLLARAVDLLAWIAWTKTEDAQKNNNQPKSLLNILLGKTDNDKNKNDNNGLQAYESPAAFLNAWKQKGGG